MKVLIKRFAEKGSENNLIDKARIIYLAPTILITPSRFPRQLITIELDGFILVVVPKICTFKQTPESKEILISFCVN